MRHKSDFNLEDYWADLALDLGTFAIWIVVGAVVGFSMAYLVGGYQTGDTMFDYYGMFGSLMAALWAKFRRQRHLYELKKL